MSSAAAAAPPVPPAPPGYHAQVEPLLRNYCIGCHGAAAPSSGLSVTTIAGLRKGGVRFGARDVIPGSSATSGLVRFLRGAEKPQMPLNHAALTDQEIGIVARWIDAGAREDVARPAWPYTAPHAVKPVKTSLPGWTATPVDRFVVAGLAAHGLRPSAPASRTVLLRRLYAALVGEPPTPAQAAAFLADRAPDAVGRLADRLLADSRFGERWGRHWLDLVRYADSDGFENDATRPLAWRYRDYVIRSINADKPYDRFLEEQLAGDEMFAGNADAVIATGYLRLCNWDANCPNGDLRHQDILNDITDTTGSVMLGLTVGCAKCHDHKYDPITQADYYRLQSFFAATQWVDQPLPDSAQPANVEREASEARAAVARLTADRSALRDAIRARLQAARPAGPAITDAEIDHAIDADHEAAARRDRDNAQLAVIDERSHYIRPFAEAVRDENATPAARFVLLRGNVATPGAPAPPSYLSALCGGTSELAAVSPCLDGKSSGRRTALAEWIASPRNPMTARVWVNRVWQHLFGAGIVATPSDFGHNGDTAGDRALLDWLAVWFEQNGWSTKRLIRMLISTAAFQQASDWNARGAAADPLNHWLWRMNRVRLEAEPLRDSILAISGDLNPEMYGPAVFPRLSEEVLSTGSTHKWGDSPPAEQLRRTVYVFQRRSLELPLVEAYDGPDTSNTCPRRSVTTIAPQALALLNGQFTREAAMDFARRVIREAGASTAARIRLAWVYALARPPAPREAAQASAFLASQAALHRADQTGPKATDPGTAAMRDLCQVLFNTNEFVTID